MIMELIRSVRRLITLGPGLLTDQIVQCKGTFQGTNVVSPSVGLRWRQKTKSEVGSEGREHNVGGKVFEDNETLGSFKAEAEHIRIAAINDYFRCDALCLPSDVVNWDLSSPSEPPSIRNSNHSTLVAVGMLNITPQRVRLVARRRPNFLPSESSLARHYSHY